MLSKTFAKPHKQLGLYKYRESKHALETKPELYNPRAYNLNVYQNTLFQKD